MTEKLFLDEPRLRTVTASVVASSADGIVLDRTIFYARSGGQPGDIGVLRWDGNETAIADTVKGDSETIVHLPAPDAALPPVGATVEGATTAHWLTDRLRPLGVSVTRVAQGVPIGGALDVLDDGTLAAALRARRPS